MRANTSLPDFTNGVIQWGGDLIEARKAARKMISVLPMLGFLVASSFGGNALALDLLSDLRGASSKINEVQNFVRVTVRWSDDVRNFSDQQSNGTAQELILEIVAYDSSIPSDIILTSRASILISDAGKSSPIAEVPISLVPVKKEDSLAEVKGSFLLDRRLADRIAIVIDLTSSQMSKDRFIISIPRS